MRDRGRILIVLLILALVAAGCGLLFLILVISGDPDAPVVSDPPATGSGPAATASATGPEAVPPTAKPSGPDASATGPGPTAAPTEPGRAAPKVSGAVSGPEPDPPAPVPAETGRVTGRVFRPDGSPQSEAWVAVHRLERQGLGLVKRGPPLARVRTRSDGRFALTAVPVDGELELTVTHPDFPVLRRKGVVARKDQPTVVGILRLLAGASLRGQVRSVEKGPLAGVVVVVRDPVLPAVLGGRPDVKARTDTEGRFAFAGLAPGKVRVEVHVPAHAPGHAVVVLEAGREAEAVELLLRRGLEIAGLVVDERDAPVAGVAVHAIADRHAVETRSNAAGAFALRHLRPEVYRLLAEKSGYGIPTGNRARWDFNAGSRDVRIRLERRATLSGTVRDAASGRPVPRFTVAWGRSAEDLDTSRSFESEDGTFTLGAVRPGPLVVEVRSPDHASRRLAPIALRVGDRIANLEVMLVSGGTIHGRVVRRSDRVPVAGVSVMITRPRRNDGSVVFGGEKLNPIRPLRSVKTGSDGVFRVEHLTGTFAIRIRHPGFAPFDREAVRSPSDGTKDLGDLRLGQGGTVTGRVPGKDGKGDAGAEVWVHGPGGYSRSVSADAQGRFVLEHVPPGRYRATVTRRGGKLALEDLIKMSREGPREVEVLEGQVSVVQF